MVFVCPLLSIRGGQTEGRIVVVTCVQDVCSYIPETNHVFRFRRDE